MAAPPHPPTFIHHWLRVSLVSAHDASVACALSVAMKLFTCRKCQGGFSLLETQMAEVGWQAASGAFYSNDFNVRDYWDGAA